MTNLKIVVNPKTDALGLIDAQDGFVKLDGDLPVLGIPGEGTQLEVIERILDLMEKPFGFTFTTEDMHTPDSVEHELLPVHCVEETPGQQICEVFESFYRTADMNLVKGDNPYLFAYSIGTSSEFDELIKRLRKARVKRIFLPGWAYGFCVGLSAIALAGQGFEVVIVRDCTRSVSVETAELMDKKLALEPLITICNLADIE